MTPSLTDSLILQPGTGHIPGDVYLATTPGSALWGWLPNAASSSVAELSSGRTITIDTLSHEGLLEDQGRNPEGYFRQFDVADVLQDAVDMAASDKTNSPEDGPHVVTGPIHVSGAKPGDVLKIDILQLARRVPYGIISNRHGFGALAGEYPEDMNSTPSRHIDSMVRDGTVSHFSWVEEHKGFEVGLIDAGQGRRARFPIEPFLGLMGTAPATSTPVPSSPPAEYGGNIDIKHAVEGSTLYLPVLTEGAGFYAGDPHFAQGNGEVALTALEASLRATLRLTVLPGSDKGETLGGAHGPVVETAAHWIPTGLDPDLNIAVQNATRNAIAFLHDRFGVPRSVALAYLSAGADFEVSQVVDGVKGIHCMIRKADWTAWV
ncbi:acetamidase/formamidase family protein [Nesterenkonia populi]|uniref:acetamidase/formamidase family protein n=1 Tax=Nesterenkonia populi TaxID=1591087 RepID=UPI0011BE6441|nr:acetamidase/formamidase family protein [Nesterenkonia populi]